MNALLDSLTAERLRRRSRPGEVPSAMLAPRHDCPFSDRGGIHERELDGMRCMVQRQGSRVRLVSRNARTMDATRPELVEALEAQERDDLVADGETPERLGRRPWRTERESSPFGDTLREKEVHFVRPGYVGEFGSTEWTRTDRLRYPRFVGLRKDEEADEGPREPPSSGHE